jgi:hypothetical protein
VVDEGDDGEDALSTCTIHKSSRSVEPCARARLSWPLPAQINALDCASSGTITAALRHHGTSGAA